MKKIIFIILLQLLNCLFSMSQEIINDQAESANLTIRQIVPSELDNLSSLQVFNQQIGNSVSTLQLGNENNVRIYQQKNNNTTTGNRSDTYQSGNSNEINLNQVGNGNMLLGVQSESLTEIEKNYISSYLNTEKSNIITLPAYSTTSSLMDGNSLNINQNGSNNGLIAIQDGTNNTFSIEQSGCNNYMYTLQQGKNNSVVDYKQENKSDLILYDKIIQIGDNLNLKVDNSLNSRTAGDTYIQTGSNLSFQLNNSQPTSLGGIEVNMTGNNMKVIVDQKYFSVPLK